MMRQLDYQSRVLKVLGEWLNKLAERKRHADKIRNLSNKTPDVEITPPDFAGEAWKAIASQLPTDDEYSPRQDAIGNHVPNATLKVPTGGGKTFLAVHAVSKVLSIYMNQQSGFVLWIVPSEAICTQTLKNLRDRAHPYRQVLDRASGDRTMILKSQNRLSKRDMESHLCIMVVIWGSAAGTSKKEDLKMFRDSGKVNGFLPPESDRAAHAALIKQVGNLDKYEGGRFPIVKESLGNALRLLRPIVILDEGHRGISENRHNTLYGFNPSCVLELTATPKKRKGKNNKIVQIPNVLVEVSAGEVDEEGMIKMPLNLETRQGTDWKKTLSVALHRLNTLTETAQTFSAESSRYIRPIMLVQVERTSAEQRDSKFIHTDDVFEYLQQRGIGENEIAIKTASQNDLKNPENQNLLSPTNRVRVIITRNALAEGWDCSFAYVLCTLAPSSNKNDMTQLVGRILRQPQALKTGVESLDECYVISHHAKTGAVMSLIRKGLEDVGLGDLKIVSRGGIEEDREHEPQKIKRSNQFKKLNILLPEVNYVENGVVRPLDYHTDILSQIDWHKFEAISEIDIRHAALKDHGENDLSTKIGISDKNNRMGKIFYRKINENLTFDPIYITQSISDIVLNPFVARSIVGGVIDMLDKIDKDGTLRAKAIFYILAEIQSGLEKWGNKEAETLFREKVETGKIQFRLRADANQYKMPDEFTLSVENKPKHLTREDGSPLQMNLFTPMFKSLFNNDERPLARNLDERDAIRWWHRNKNKSYGLQGWQRHKVYPDFIFAVNQKTQKSRLLVLESKGDHLEGYEDTRYKQRLLKHLTENFKIDNTTPSGEKEFISADDTSVECHLILFKDIDNELPQILASN